MTTLDLIILAACAAGLWRGFQTGLIRQATSLIGYAIALIFALALMDQTGLLVAESLGLSARVAPVVGFVVVFVVLLILVSFLTNLLERALEAVSLSAVNRVAGGAVGVLKAALSRQRRADSADVSGLSRRSEPSRVAVLRTRQHARADGVEPGFRAEGHDRGRARDVPVRRRRHLRRSSRQHANRPTMTPVALRLNNFLSYGEAGDTSLQFDSFHVACLSGGNGQGKSALLDAITYAMWGMARKSSVIRKPDADLLRRGARDMWVELDFDIEGQRHRVKRSYTETASGKTSKSELNLFVWNADASAWRAMTGTNQRETQERIDSVVGLDYDTFTNSSFLLQGQSDAFTKRNPSERKEVLARILNLSRYDRLADKAGERAKAARKEAEFLERERERLNSELAAVPRLEEEQATMASRVAERTDLVAALEADAQQHVGTVEALRVRGAERDALTRDRETAQYRADRVAGDLADTKHSLGAADALIDQAAQIERDAAEYASAQTEQSRLAEKAAQASALDGKLSTLQREIDQLNSEHTRKVDNAASDLSRTTDRIADLTRALSSREETQRRVQQALAAQTERDRLLDLERKALDLDDRKRQAERTLEREHDRLATLVRQSEEAAAALVEQLEAGRSLERQLAEAKQGAAGQAELEAHLADVQQRGIEARDRKSEIDAQIESLNREVAALEQRRIAIRETQDATCPTCGTELTDQHRRHVDSELQAERSSVQGHIAERSDEAEVIGARIVELRERFKEAKARQQQAADAVLTVARLQEQQKSLTEKRARLDDLRAASREASEQLDANTYAPDARRLLDRVDHEQQELAFDPQRLTRAREAAAGLDQAQHRLAELDAQALQRDQLTEQKAALEQRHAELLAQTDQLLGDRPGEIERLKSERSELGYDPERARTVADTLRRLGGAPTRLDHLARARDVRPTLAERHERLQIEVREVTAQIAGYVERLASFGTLSADLASAEQALAEARKVVTQRRAELTESERRLAVTTAQLARLSEERKALAANREKARESDETTALYKHLRTAFGPKGIQSLIIEQTLPEIEDRANDLLAKLSDGTMSVRLETLRDKQGGGTAETLDITISDSTGAMRPYETFSGGEAFRVNFALRIALSQLLAERAGVQIRTLVIDEGFGTQDAQGIERLIQAINTVQDDFDKILVVTHLEEMKDAFPVRIQVQKLPGKGSTFQLVGV